MHNEEDQKASKETNPQTKEDKNILGGTMGSQKKVERIHGWSVDTIERCAKDLKERIDRGIADKVLFSVLEESGETVAKGRNSEHNEDNFPL